MIRQTILLALIVLSVFHAQSQNLKRISKFMEKSDFEKAKETLDKEMLKDSSSFGLMYFYSLYFVNKGQPYYNLDSSRIYIFKALELRPKATEDQKDDWAKTDMPLANIDSAKMLITKLSFAKAKDPLSLSSVLIFIENFPSSPFENKAIYLRDSLAYENTKTLNTWKAYKHYMDTYPSSTFWVRAETNYEWLLFKDKTKNGTLSEYELFVKNFPNTHHRKEAEAFIFSRRTYDHYEKSYQLFIEDYPKSHFTKRAFNYLYYKEKANGAINLNEIATISPNADSLLDAARLSRFPLIPILSEDRFTFLTAYGDTIKALNPQKTDPAYKCGNIIYEWLRVKDQNGWKIVNRAGKTLAKEISKITYLSAELILLETASGSDLYHQSGIKLNQQPIQEAKVLNDQFIAIQQSNKWGVLAFNGTMLLAPSFDQITQAGTFIILEKEDRYMALNVSSLNPDKPLEDFNFPFDDFEVFSDTLFIGFNEDKEALMDKNLKTLIPLGKQQINVSKPIWFVKRDSSYMVFDRIKGEPITPGFSDLAVNDQWLAMQRGNKWTLRALKDTVASILTPLDSVVLLNEDVAYIERRDSAFLFFQNGSFFHLDKNSSFTILRSIDEKKTGQRFVMYTSRNEKNVLDRAGNSVLKGKYEDVQYLDDSTFIVKSRSKYGVYHRSKGLIIKPIYDHITETGGLVYLLKGNLIGLLDLSSGIILPPEYPSKPEKFMNGFLVSKNNKQGVTINSKEWKIKPEYDELKQWNDTSFWGKKDDLWTLQSVAGEILIGNVVSLRKWENDTNSDYLLFMKEDKYGVASPSKGLVVPPAYNDIINIGTADLPIFFAEQHLKTADFFVVTYFDPNGKVIKSQAYRPNEYDQVYCDQ